MPDLVRLYIRHTVIGFVIALAFVAVLFWFNVANLWYLVTHTEDGPLAAFLLVMFNGIVFSGVQFGIAVMQMQTREDDDQGGAGSRELASQAAPIPVRVTDGRRP